MREFEIRLEPPRTQRGGKVESVTVHVAATRAIFTATERQMPPLDMFFAYPPGARPGQTFFKPKMAWRPYENLMDGELDNRTPGSVKGWMRFHRTGKPPFRVILELMGDCHEDIRGKVIRISNPHPSERNEHLKREGSYMDGFSPIQQGQAGDITAGAPVGLDGNGEPRFPYAPYPYLEWYGPNGRVVLELDASQLEIVDGTTVRKVPRSAGEYYTEADAIQQLRALVDGSIRFSVDQSEGS